jgi:hypothetical protein
MDAQPYKAGADQIVASNKAIGASSDEAAGKIETTQRRLGESTARYIGTIRQLDPALAGSITAQQKLETGSRNLQRALDVGAISVEQHAKLMLSLRDQYDRNVSGANDNSRAVNTLADSHERFSIQGQAAFHAARSMAEGIALGIPPTQILTQQLNHLSFAASGPGGLSGAFGEVVRGIGAFITPTTAAVAGVAAIGAAFAVVAARAANNEAALRSFAVALGPLDNGTQQTALHLQEAARQLRDLGVAATAANAAIAEIARNPLLNPNGAGQIANIGANVGARLGLSPDAGVKTFADAIAGGIDSIVKLGVQVRALDANEVANILTMQRHGQQAEAMARAIDLIRQSVDGAHEKSLSPFQAAVENLTAAWNNMLNAFANTSAINGAMNAITGLFGGLAGIVNGVSSSAGSNAASSWNAMGQGLTGLPGASGGLVQGGALDAIVRSMIRVESGGNPNAVSPAGAGGLMQLIPGTAAGLGITNPFDPTQNVLAGARYIQQLIQQFGSIESGLMAYNWGPGNYQKYLNGDKALPSSVRNYAQNVIAGAGSPASGDLRAPDADALGRATNEIRHQHDELTALTPEWQKFGSAQQAGVAAAQAYAKVLEETGSEELASKAATEARTRVIAEATAQLSKEQQVQKATTEGALAEAKAYGVDAVAGYKAAADAQARLLVMQEPLKNFEVERQRLLEASAAEAINAAAKALPAIQQQIAANQRLADAAKQGTAAEHEAALQNQAAAATHDALTKAIASGNQSLIDQAKALTDQTLAQIKANDAAKVAAELAHQTNIDRNDIQIMQLEVSLQGQTSEEISRQVALLREKQRLDALGSSVTQQERDDRLAVVDALGRQNSALVEAQRNQQRLDEGVRQIADTVDNSLVKAMQDAFDGKKVTDWGATLKSVVSQILSGILNFALIRPAIGSVVGALGFGNVASQFGSFSGLGGSSSAGGGLNTGTLLQGGGLLKDMFGSIVSRRKWRPLWRGQQFPQQLDVGPELGFALPGAGPGGIPGLATPLFNTSFTGFLGGAGLGFGAGSLLNSLIGGNTLGGTVGSGLGSLAGAAIGSIVPGIGTLIGGLLGGAGGGLLGGLFGNNRPANNESAGGLNLATGQVTSFSSHGVAANDQAVQQFLQPLQTFISNLLQVTGGQLQGTLGFQAGSRDGSKLMYNNVPGFGSGELKITDSQPNCRSSSRSSHML